MVKDPVCGMEVEPQTAPASTIYAGHVYYFCAEGCKNQFEQDPGRFILKIQR